MREKYKEVEGIDTSTYAGKGAIAAKTKFRGIMDGDLLTNHLIDFVTFMQLNTRFNSKNIFVTEENKEEAYIQIIETGDDSLISDLEKFLELTDRIKTIQQKKDEYEQIIEKLQQLTDFNDEKAVNTIVEEYLRR